MGGDKASTTPPLGADVVFQVFPSKKIIRQKWYWRAVAANGQIIGQSEGYVNHDDAWATAEELAFGRPVTDVPA